nr:hypothetical protein [Tanacetum cinerariifolium]
MGVGSWFSVLKQVSSDFIPRIVWVEIEGVPFKLWSKILLNGLPLSGESYWTLMIRKRKVFIRKEVPGWVPKFVDDSDDDDESDNGFKDGDAKVQDGGSCGDDSDEVEVPETVFEESLEQKENQSKDPFGIYLLLNKNKDKSKNMKPSDHSLKYPPGFTPNGDNNEFCTLKIVSQTEDYQKYGALIPDGMINQDIMLSTVYKTYLDYGTGKVPPKKAKKFKKPASLKLKTVTASPKEPTQKGKRVKKT